jgi:hypothetical protein
MSNVSDQDQNAPAEAPAAKPNALSLSLTTAKKVRRHEMCALTLLRRAKPDWTREDDPNDYTYPSAASRLARVCAARGESFAHLCKRLNIPQEHRLILSRLVAAKLGRTKSSHTKRRAARVADPSKKLRINEKSSYTRPPVALAPEVAKRLRRNELNARTLLAGARTDMAPDDVPNYLIYPAVATRFARACATTGESFTSLCERLGISQTHTSVLSGLVAKKLATIARKRHISEQLAAAPFRRIRTDLPADDYPNYCIYANASRRLARICTATGESIAEVCARLGIRIPGEHMPFLSNHVAGWIFAQKPMFKKSKTSKATHVRFLR